MRILLLSKCKMAWHLLSWKVVFQGESSPVHSLLRHGMSSWQKKGKKCHPWKDMKSQEVFSTLQQSSTAPTTMKNWGGHSTEGTWRWTFLFFRNITYYFSLFALLFSASWHRSMSMTETCDHLSQNFPATTAEAPSAPRLLLINAQLLLLQAQHNTESNKPTLDNKARM